SARPRRAPPDSADRLQPRSESFDRRRPAADRRSEPPRHLPTPKAHRTPHPPAGAGSSKEELDAWAPVWKTKLESANFERNLRPSSAEDDLYAMRRAVVGERDLRGACGESLAVELDARYSAADA